MTLTAQRRTVTATYPSAAAAASAAVDVIDELLRAGALRNLGVATGSSPSPVYREMARRRIDLSAVTLFALDEYIGLPAGHPETYRAVVEREIAEPLAVPRARVHLPDGDDPEAYDDLIAARGGIDLQILGIGRNGHIGFNEPGSSFDSRTRVVDLDASTRAANARFFDDPDDVPRRSVTQGIGTILEARRLIVVVSGAEKAAAVAAAIDGPRTEAMPASVLREHPDVTWLLDEAAASHLSSRSLRDRVGA
ncbi:glucosamine-6-phosphate deaminase [Microbacterium sp. 1.5R]|uniref:glucosamine-6-phosphate deaminase n=1 Tax=Microbacterium sp. 1.5R TaxID=1916917 RepID=UPI0011A248B1|nr:glucosamine-6-phosphate deaminase [Microbacterium sp. 1.5R]